MLTISETGTVREVPRRGVNECRTVLDGHHYTYRPLKGTGNWYGIWHQVWTNGKLTREWQVETVASPGLAEQFIREMMHGH